MAMKRLAIYAIALLAVGCGGGGKGGSGAPGTGSAGAPPPPPLPAGSVALSDATYTVVQSTGLLTVEVKRTDGTRDGSVSYATADGTAVAGTEYTARNGTLTWASGDGAAKTISLPINPTVAGANGKTFTVTLSNATNGISLGTPTTATVTINAPTQTTTTPPKISVKGNRLVDGSGSIVQLRGVSFSGFEFIAIGGSNPDDPSGGLGGQPYGPKWSAMKNWHANTVRFGLNEASWLGGSCVDTDNVTRNPDPGNNYRSRFQEQVKEATDAGLYVIIELHWAAPGNTCPMIQTQMANADHSIAFWTSVANTFKSNSAVMFSLYNEPYFYGLSAGLDQWDVMMTKGGTATYYPASSATHNYKEIQGTWTIVSMQQLIDAIRATGATNVLLVGGVGFSNDMSNWLAKKPTDPLAQMVAAWHPYPPIQTPSTVTVATGGTGYAVGNSITLVRPNNVYLPTEVKVTSVGANGVVTGISVTTPGLYLQTLLPKTPLAQASTNGSGSGATFTVGGWNNYSSNWSMPDNWATVQAISAQVPVIIAETGEHNEPGTDGAPFLQTLLPFAGANNWSVVGCCWSVFQNRDNVLIKDVDGTPTDGYGKVMYDWMRGVAWQ